ncbi:MAG TPA: iron-sulfur cluster assembly scaffold protein [Aggregatilineales bacterium]|nr:iron-sulfur cluster assembly scaffold protein [Aggregatilineales bacterium]
MDRQAYIENIQDHFDNPRHHGVMDNASISMKGGNPGCGDIVTVYLKLDAQERITDYSFDGEGCTISQAAASMLGEYVIGKTLKDVKNLDYNAFIDDIGREVVMNRPKCATLALNTVKAAERKFRSMQAEEHV